MKQFPNLCTGMAFDNFDRFGETSSDKDTLHDTVCIAYQRETEEGADEIVEQQNEPEVSVQKVRKPLKRRGAYISHDLDIEPYLKKLKLTSQSMVSLDDERRKIIPTFESLAKLKDLFGRWSGFFSP